MDVVYGGLRLEVALRKEGPDAFGGGNSTGAPKSCRCIDIYISLQLLVYNPHLAGLIE